MKAVTKIIIPIFLSLAGVVLAAPHQSALKISCLPAFCSAGCTGITLNCREKRNCIAKAEASLPPVHDASSFLYW